MDLSKFFRRHWPIILLVSGFGIPAIVGLLLIMNDIYLSDIHPIFGTVSNASALAISTIIPTTVVLIFIRAQLKKWISRNRFPASILLLVLFLVTVGEITWALELQQSVIVAALIGALIPGIYYVYVEIIRRPSVVLHPISFSEAKVVPIYLTPHVARPVILLPVKVENLGRETAVDCTVKIWLSSEDRNTAVYYAKWAVPDNRERYDLLPGETQNINILKIYLLRNFFLLKDPSSQEIQHANQTLVKTDLGFSSLTDMQNSTIFFDTAPSGTVKMEGDPQNTIQQGDIISENIRDQICCYYPVRGNANNLVNPAVDTWGGEKLPMGEYIVEAQGIAENYKKEKKRLEIIDNEDNVLSISANRLTSIVGNDRIEWDIQWENKGYSDIKQDIIDACKELNGG